MDGVQVGSNRNKRVTAVRMTTSVYWGSIDGWGTLQHENQRKTPQLPLGRRAYANQHSVTIKKTPEVTDLQREQIWVIVLQVPVQIK